MPNPIAMPFRQPGQTDGVPPELDGPRAAVIEIVERHSGPAYPYAGAGSIICPNHLRINGAAVWATRDDPVQVTEFTVGGQQEFAVTLRLLARALRVGAAASFVAGAEDLDAVNGAVIEIPDYDEPVAGSGVQRPYVLVNGRRVFTAGMIHVERLATHGVDRGALVVRLPLLCRKLTVDDEPLAPPAG